MECHASGWLEQIVRAPSAWLSQFDRTSEVIGLAFGVAFSTGGYTENVISGAAAAFASAISESRAGRLAHCDPKKFGIKA
jgi:hypothetical protein